MFPRTPVIRWEKPRHLIFIQSLIMLRQFVDFSATSRLPPPRLIWVWAMTTPQSSPSYIRFDFWSSTLIIKVFIFLIIKDKKSAGCSILNNLRIWNPLPYFLSSASPIIWFFILFAKFFFENCSDFHLKNFIFIKKNSDFLMKDSYKIRWKQGFRPAINFSYSKF